MPYKNREKYLAYQRAYAEKNRVSRNAKKLQNYYDRSAEGKMYYSARERARKLGLPCTITLEDIIIPEFCPFLDIKLEKGVKVKQDCSPSLDRIIPELGYVPGNVMVISELANRMKNSATIEQLKLFAERVFKLYGDPEAE